LDAVETADDPQESPSFVLTCLRSSSNGRAAKTYIEKKNKKERKTPKKSGM